MPTISALTTFTSNTQAKAAEVNANFSTIRTTVNTYCAFVDQSATISGAWTFSTAPTISGALTLGAQLTITTGGIAVTGNSSVTGTLTATTFSGSGASLTNLPSSALTGALPALDGSALTSLNGSNIASGTVAAARLPTSYTTLSFSNGLTLTGGAITLNQTTGTPAVLAFGISSTHIATGSGSVPAFTSNAPAAGGSWSWVRVTTANGLGTAYIPILNT